MLAARFLRFLTMLAILLSPLTMIAGGPARAMAHQVAAMDVTGHCADMEKKSKDRPGRSADCLVTCAAIPAAGTALEAHPAPTSAVPPIPLFLSLHGLRPEAATPPPRFS